MPATMHLKNGWTRVHALRALEEGHTPQQDPGEHFYERNLQLSDRVFRCSSGNDKAEAYGSLSSFHANTALQCPVRGGLTSARTWDHGIVLSSLDSEIIHRPEAAIIGFTTTKSCLRPTMKA